MRTLADQNRVEYSLENIGESGAWRNSVPLLLKLLCDVGLGHIQVFLEYRLPYSPRRVDAVLCGVHPESGRASYVLVELKQWSDMKVVGPGLVKFNEKREQPELHPAEQVRRYCRYLLDFTPSLARTPGAVQGMAYLHNLSQPNDASLDDFGQFYTADQTSDLVTALTSFMDTDPGTAAGALDAVQELIEAPRAPARTLLKTAATAFAGRQSYLLLDAQKVAYDLVLRAAEQVDRPDVEGGRKKTVVVVRGGPGSGKSVIAIALLSRLAERWGRVLHATGSRAFTETLRRDVAGGDERSESIFKYFNNFDKAPRDSLDVLICDEAHRIRENNVPVHLWEKFPPQVAKLIDVARVPVFLLDENQKVRPKESYTARQIAAVAKAKGCLVQNISLDGQFRCGGSPLYDKWVLRLLGIVDGGPVPWSEFVAERGDEYVVDSVGSPSALEAWLERQRSNFGGTARIAAGFCWKWHDPVVEDGVYRLVDDVKIGDWRRPWNVRQGKEADGFPSASYWASDPDGASQIGCIYTAQGFEYDWAGVIFGGDLVVRSGKWVPQPSKSEDWSVNRVSDNREFLQLVRNTYKVLMTRGMQGVCLYSEDRETSDFLRRYCR
ncbi:DUF2075 domain-containing protein [Actinophytocola sp.]|uniref:DUF2075 domain-containing protein n=1 Tax=Actinophytocola sp. TaxID=1872138 RepID=UPI002ED42AAE